MPVEERAIVHFDLDSFFVEVERLQNSQLKGVPVIIGGHSERAVVSSCSYETRKYGVHSAMPMKKALSLCPQAIVVNGHMDLYGKYSNMVTEIISEVSPIFEKASIDEHYIDITGMDRFYGSYKWAHELRMRIINEIGLPISFGLSINKTVAKIATGEAKPNGEKYVPKEMVRSFLNPLPINKIPMIGEKTTEVLHQHKIYTVEQLSNLSQPEVENMLGNYGIMIWNKANGIDNSPVIPYHERKSISTEETFDIDIDDLKFIDSLMVYMTEKLAYQLRREEKLASCVTVKIRYSNFATQTIQKQIPYSAFDEVILGTSRELFKRLYKRGLKIRLIGIRLSNLVQGSQQIDLFNDTREMINLYQALDNMKKKYGRNVIQRAGGMKSGREAEPPKD
ncbi:MAG: DNA polymerase IV [Bacteroidota bacterium]|nr:DNA polymerase IV [Bacteroidota bacterium]